MQVQWKTVVWLERMVLKFDRDNPPSDLNILCKKIEKDR